MARSGSGFARRRGGVRVILALGLFLPAFAGCVGLQASSLPGRADPAVVPTAPGRADPAVVPTAAEVSPMSGGWPAGSLTAADETSDEDIGFLTTPSPAPAPAPAERDWRLGLRAGFFLTAASEEGWDSSVSFGAFYRGRHGQRLVYELGLDHATVESGDGSVSSQLLFFRGEGLFGKWDAQDRKAGFYLLAGGQGIAEQAELDGSGRTESRTGAAVNLGLGVGSPRGSWDVRAVYSVILGSDNAEGDLVIATGFAF